VAARDWLEMLEYVAPNVGPGVRAQLALADFPDRLAAYRAITVPSLVIGFADDRVVPTYLAREVAEAIPGARYEQVEQCGHYGYLERPAEVNRLLTDFFATRPARVTADG
nr:alpha/beta fold hydrolase [Micromonospora sp. DSM 115978]